MVLIIIRIIYKTKVFKEADIIETTYQLVYWQIIKEKNYLKLSKEKTVR